MNKTRLLAGLLLIACQSKPSVVPAPATAPPASATPETRVAVGETVRAVWSPRALAAFQPAVPAVDSGGECRLVRTSGSGATMVTASFPSLASARNSVTLAFDSVGHLVRYSEARGAIRFTYPPGFTEAQRDSMRRAIQAKTQTTTISLDWAVDQGLLSNRGGGRPPEAIMANVRDIENLEKLGPPSRRIAHVRKLCGV